MNANGWLARCSHPGCNEQLLVDSSMKTLPHDASTRPRLSK